MNMYIRSYISLIILSLTTILYWSSCCPSAFAQQTTTLGAPVTAVAILTKDDQGHKLKYPSSVFCDHKTGEIYVVSSGNAKVVIYSADYFPETSIGKGRGIDAPEGVYVDKNGNIYIAQGPTAKHPAEITVLNAALFPVKQIRFTGFKDAKMFVPVHIIQDRNGNFYVAGINSLGIVVLDKNGKFLRKLIPQEHIAPAPASEGMAGFLSHKRSYQQKSHISKDSGKVVPVHVTDVTTDDRGRLFLLSEGTSKIYVYTPQEDFLYSFGQKGGTMGKTSRPRGIAIDNGTDRVYVCDYMRHTILAYTLGGKFIFEFGGKGWSVGWFNYPTSVAVDPHGNVIVADLFNQRVQILKIGKIPANRIIKKSEQ